MRALHTSTLCLALFVSSGIAEPASAGRPRPPGTHEASGFQIYASPQSNPIVACPNLGFVFVASTTSNRVDVISIAGASPVWAAQVPVGMEPVSLAARPDGTGGCGGELWVANHLSDSVSVIDIDTGSASFLRVVETIQSIDPATRATLFDEPVGIAFSEDGVTAFVALSSRNQIARIDATTHAITTIPVNGQEPRALAVRNGRLFVTAFESDNRTELSSCADADPPSSPQCTVDIGDIIAFATSPNLPGLEVNIVADPQRPDRDLFVYRVADGQLLEAVEGVGTLLYGVAVGADGTVFVTQTDARNDANGEDSGVLVDLENRMFLNQLTRIECGDPDASPCQDPTRIQLDADLPAQPLREEGLATPYGVALSQDGSILLGTAAATSRLFSLETSTNTVKARLDVGSIPRGVAFVSTGATGKAYVLNTLANTVSVVTVGPEGALLHGPTIAVGADPTPEVLRRGRIAFESAFASDSATFSCASCHPDAHTDQLLWRIGGACVFTGCDAAEPRSTMPVRGLRDTLPLHWDGTLGDPFGAQNGAGTGGTDCSLGDADGDHDCFVDLVEESLAGVMCDQMGACPPGGGQLSSQERDDMAFFLASISYPPPRSRRPNDQVSPAAFQGFKDFFMDQGGALEVITSTCADSAAGCHELPLGTATNSLRVGRFDAPTMRGMTDRFIHFSNGITGSQEFISSQSTIGWTPALAMSEFATFDGAFPNLFEPGYGAPPDEMFQMFEEASTGSSGALGRQVTLNSVTAAGCPACPAETLLAELEAADARGVVNLRGSGMRNGSGVTISFVQGTSSYQVGAATLTRAQLVAEAQAGTALASLTAHLRSGTSTAVPQPLVAPLNANCGTGTGATGNPVLPSGTTFTVQAKYVAAGDAVFVDGLRRTGATLTVLGAPTTCSETIADARVQVNVGASPALSTGAHLLQVQNAGGTGLLSNEMPFCVGNVALCN